MMNTQELRDFGQKYKNKKEKLIKAGEFGPVDDLVRGAITALKSHYKEEVDYTVTKYFSPEAKKASRALKHAKRNLKSIEVGELNTFSEDTRGNKNNSELRPLVEILKDHTKIPKELIVIAELYFLDQGCEDLFQAFDHIDQFYYPENGDMTPRA